MSRRDCSNFVKQRKLYIIYTTEKCLNDLSFIFILRCIINIRYKTVLYCVEVNANIE